MSLNPQSLASINAQKKHAENNAQNNLQRAKRSFKFWCVLLLTMAAVWLYLLFV